MAAGKCASFKKGVHHAQQILNFLGACVGIAFAMQGVLVFIGPAVGHDERPTENFRTFCHWASEAALCLWVGIAAVIMEVRACCPRISQQLGRHILSSLGRALLYVWIGGYSSGGRIQMGDLHWQLIGQITGFAAWVVCLGHLLLACCTYRPEKQDVSEAVDGQDEEAGDSVVPTAASAEQVEAGEAVQTAEQPAREQPPEASQR